MRVHECRIYLAPELYLGIVKLQADREIGKPYAVLLAVTEGLHNLGYISKEAYEAYSKKYSEKLVKEKIEPLTPKEQIEISKLSESFYNIMKNWEDVKNKEFWVKKAEWALKTYGVKKIPAAKELLEMANKGVVSCE